jgi:hypothetical protein
MSFTHSLLSLGFGSSFSRSRFTHVMEQDQDNDMCSRMVNSS